MAITFACPHCRQSYTINSLSAGKEIGCRMCGETMRVAGKPVEIVHVESTPAPPVESVPYFPDDGPAFAPVRRRRPRVPAFALFAAACAVLIAVVGLGAAFYGRLSPPADDAIELTGNQPNDDFERNLIGAETKWAGKKVRFSGPVTEIGQDRDGFFVVISNSFIVYPSERNLEPFGMVAVWQSVRVECVITGYVDGIPIRVVGNRGKLLQVVK